MRYYCPQFTSDGKFVGYDWCNTPEKGEGVHNHVRKL